MDLDPNLRRGFFVRIDKLKHWKTLFEKWCLAIERYARVRRYPAYWWNERSNVGVLAAAAWRCGYVALEEWPTNKRKRRGEKGHGRCDLWIATEHAEEAIEAKYAEINLSRGSDAFLNRFHDCIA